MIRPNLHHLLLLLHVAISLHSVGAPSPPKIDPDWLEKFLEMDWEQGSKIEVETHQHGGNSHQSMSHLAGDMYIPAQSVVAPHQNALLHQSLASLRQDGREPSITSALRDPATSQPQLGASHGQQALHLPGLPSFDTNTASFHTSITPDIGGEPSTSFVPASGSLHPVSSYGTPSGVSGQPEVHVHSPAIPLQVSAASAIPGEGLPYVLRMSDTCVYQPSDKLMDEMFDYLLPSQPKLPAGMRRIPDELIRFGFQQDTKHYFRAGTKVYVVQLPSQLVFIRFFPKEKFAQQALFSQIMTIWSGEVNDGSSLLTLRGAWSVAAWLPDSVIRMPTVLPCFIKMEIFSDRMSGYAVVRKD
ncbi:uncharacterized protein UTRI_01127 [Ustilago trichophora]|uniref:Effector family protein Eff1 n=1 Tax=Ustilago trichophora TaxID=86804 RepID=A0A5C3DZB2_9BASI|nr:uncharacterized protein UTRI_01127 [Ustilago trichophora]